MAYSDHQRLELEKEFQQGRYITAMRKLELANTIKLSGKQVDKSYTYDQYWKSYKVLNVLKWLYLKVELWFQNR